MIEDLRATALLGTAREPMPEIQAGGELDDLLTSVPSDDRESALLLTAGALAVWQRAGYHPTSAPEQPRAPADTLPGCSEDLAQILRRMLQRSDPSPVPAHASVPADSRLPGGVFGASDDLLPEALELLRRNGMRLRYHLLPDVLPIRAPELRRALRVVIGARGSWLAHFNPTWVWAADALPDYAEWLWQNGRPEYRLDLLELHRRLDPAGARGRLEARFPAERADVRLILLAGLETGLSLDDEPFLEGVLDTGTPAVRARAARLLALLPQSACARRLSARADMMVLKNPAKGRDRVHVVLPDSLDQTWRRDGLEPQGGLPGLDPPGNWLMQTVGLVPVRHWVDRFGMTSAALIAGLEGDRALQLLEAWTQAAILHGERALYPALWDAWWDRRAETMRALDLLATIWCDLAASMEPSALAERLARMGADPVEPEITYGRVLSSVPWPWPESVAETFLHVLRVLVPTLIAGENPPVGWMHVLLPGARGIPAGYIEPALTVLRPLSTLEAPLDIWEQVLDVVREKLHLRQQFREELSR